MLSSLLLGACSTTNPVLTFFFDGVPAPGEEQAPTPVVRQPRRAPYVPPESKIHIIEIPERPPPVDWRARYEALPKNDEDGVDWMRALNEGIITPRPGLAENAAEEEPTDMDVELVPEGMPEYKVVFPHKSHTQWLVCDNCHAGMFEMAQGADEITMDKINAGEYCGVCHGKVALPNLESCPACHTDM